MTVSYGQDVLIEAARAAAVAFLARLDEASGASHSDGRPAESGDLIEFDPLHDEPPFAPDPSSGASKTQQRMAWVTYLGAIGRLNAKEGRGANSKEVSEFARKAGYSGGNAVNGWNSRPGSPRLVENIAGARFLNDAGLEGITKDAAMLGIKLQGEVATVPQSE